MKDKNSVQIDSTLNMSISKTKSQINIESINLGSQINSDSSFGIESQNNFQSEPENTKNKSFNMEFEIHDNNLDNEIPSGSRIQNLNLLQRWLDENSVCSICNVGQLKLNNERDIEGLSSALY